MSEVKNQSALLSNLHNTPGGRGFVARLKCFSGFDNRKLHKGWERWLQYELLYLLKERNQSIRKPEFEVPYKYDGRKSLPQGKVTKKGARIDLTYEVPNTLKGLRHAIELKMARSLRLSLVGALKDLVRLRAKKGDWKFRSVTAIAVYMNDGKENSKFCKLKKALEELKPKSGAAKTVDIGGGYKAIVIGWESRPNSVSRKGYTEWCARIENACKKEQVTLY